MDLRSWRGERAGSDVVCNIHSNRYTSFPAESLASSGSSIFAVLPASLLSKQQTEHFIKKQDGAESNF